MKISKTYSFFIILATILTFFAEYEFLNVKTTTLPTKTIQHLDEDRLNMFRDQIDTTKDKNTYWGYKDEKTIKEEAAAKEAAAKEAAAKEAAAKKLKHDLENKIKRTNGKNEICISSSCYKLLGIHQQNNIIMGSFYNKNLPSNIKTYIKHDMIVNPIMIENITPNTVVLREVNTTNRWVLKIFDVNPIKYKPKKDTNE